MLTYSENKASKDGRQYIIRKLEVTVAKDGTTASEQSKKEITICGTYIK